MAPAIGATETTRADIDAKLQKVVKEAEENAAKSTAGEKRYCYLDTVSWETDLVTHEGENRSFIWSAGHIDPFPDVIPMGPSGIHVYYKGGDFPEDFKGGVCYINRTGPVERKWVFAFDLAAGKVWVDAGPRGPVNWNEVEAGLNASGPEMFYKDPILNTVAIGKIISRPGLFTMAHAGFFIESLDAKLQKVVKEAEENAAKSTAGEKRYCYLDTVSWETDLVTHEGENRSFIWSAGHIDPFPDVIPMGPSGIHVYYKGGDFPEDFKGGVCYINRTGPVERKWVFAFDLAAGKVWVDAGPRGPVNWNEVEAGLNASGPEMFYKDPILNTVAIGKIISRPGLFTMAHAGFFIE